MNRSGPVHQIEDRPVSTLFVPRADGQLVALCVGQEATQLAGAIGKAAYEAQRKTK